MAHPDIFRLAPDQAEARQAAGRLFESVKHVLEKVLPATAEILHIGATAVPGCLTKGDLDIVVRVGREDFPGADATLADRFTRNSGSIRTDDFAAFEDETRTPHLGVQLTVRGGAFDDFHRFAGALRADPTLVRRYNALKEAHDGRPMADYRSAKDAFVAAVLDDPARYPAA